MPSVTVKNIPEEIYERLKKSAAAHRRSINKEVIHCLDRALGSARLDPDAFLARLDFLQRKIRVSPLTDRVLRKAKEEGRP
jgi:plasmid stability protein